MPLPLVMGAIAVGSGALKMRGAQRAHSNQLSAYRRMSEVTPAEREYQEHLRKISEGGDPFQNQMMREQMNRVIGNIRQTGAEQLQRTEGSIIGQGMENSIVAQELRRKVDKDTMRSIAEQSRRISAENRAQQERTKREAQDRLFQSRMQTDARKQQMDAKIAGMGEFDRMGALGNIALSGVQAYMGAGGGIPFTGEGFMGMKNMKSQQDFEFDQWKQSGGGAQYKWKQQWANEGDSGNINLFGK